METTHATQNTHADNNAALDGEVIAWMRSRPAGVKALMRRLPPGCIVRGTRPLICPAPGETAVLFSYTEVGQVSVVNFAAEIRCVCEPDWLEPVAFQPGLTLADVARILDA